MAVTVSGMFGNDKTYFADSPVVIDIDGLEWPPASPFNMVRIEVLYDGRVAGDFRADTGGQTSISFNISSALQAIWSNFRFDKEVGAANSAKNPESERDSFTADADNVDFFNQGVRKYREYALQIFTEYLDSQDGEFITTRCKDKDGNAVISGGRCAIGWMTEWERSTVGDKADADVSHYEHHNLRNGDASTKPDTSPERVGVNSITSWVDVEAGGTKSVFYPANAPVHADDRDEHAPIVLRDSQPYVDFLFVNRRGAVETCSGLTFESMGIDVDVQQYSRVERPSFIPSRSMTSITQSGARRSWEMSSGHVDRDWAEWWTTEFLQARQWWMLYKGTYVPVMVKSEKNRTVIYDRSKQQMQQVDFTVTLALEG